MSGTPKNEHSEAEWTWSEDPASGVASVSGEIDFTVTPKMRELLAAFIQRTPQNVTLDLGGLNYVDSSGLAAFIEARKILVAKGRSIVISNISPQVRRLFDLTQIGELFGL